MDRFMMKYRNDALFGIFDICMQELKILNDKVYQLIRKDEEISLVITDEISKVIAYESEFINDGWDDDAIENLFMDNEIYIDNFIKSHIDKYVKDCNEEEYKKTIELANKKKHREEQRKISSKQQINKFSTFYTEDEQIGLYDEDF
jgi:hypothetical protein